MVAKPQGEGKTAAIVRVGIGRRVVEIHVPSSYLSAIVRVAAHIGDTPADEAKSSLLTASHDNHPVVLLRTFSISPRRKDGRQ